MPNFLRDLTEPLLTLGLMIGSIAVIAILVSKKSNTAGVAQAVASGFGNTLAVAESPVTGAQTPINLAYPNSDLSFGGFSPSLAGGFG